MSEPAVRTLAPARAAMEAPIRLREGGMLKLQGGHGVRIQAIEGRLWIIQETAVPDLELEAGQSLQIGNGGSALIQALTASTLSLVPERHRDRPGVLPVVSTVGTG
jgi:hypothetical protein